MKKNLTKAYKLLITISGGVCLLYGGLGLVLYLIDGVPKKNEYIFVTAPIAYGLGIFSFCSIHKCKKLKFTIPFAIILPLFIMGSFFGVVFLLEALGYDIGIVGLIAWLALTFYTVRRANILLLGKA